MQRRMIRLPKRSAGAPRTSDFGWGVVGLALLAVVGLVVSVASVVDFGTSTYTAKAYDAGAIGVGDDVRVAGIPVGEVTAVTLADDHVRIELEVDSDVFVGSESTLSVRMLTVVGGNYVALIPSGSGTLIDREIRYPVETPYNLPELFQDAIEPLDGMDGVPLRETLAQLSGSLTESPASIRELVSAADSLVGVLDRQNADVSRTLAMAEEYLTALNENRSSVRQIIDSWNIMEDMAEQSLESVGSALSTVARMLERLGPLGTHWDSELRPRIEALDESIPPLQDLQFRLTAFLDSARALGDQLRPLAGPEPDVTICVPLPERHC
ncbi:MlaD family protein [Rhodococcus artemisiae]|uniref:MlaD family protein n=1 Tax=Rhodococcus artemisiae TaxID=714159 RepID=A0ABU7LCB3_9NOCA|nr:MlaD family protein [Rhodococcus artemisiae]MEE2058557.1 MlaD family protein [Rhodococcus artemisiae]